MYKVKVYYNKNCKKCNIHAQRIRTFDLFGWVETTTDVPKEGPIDQGEILVEDISSGKTYRNLSGARYYFRFIPIYWLFLPILYLPNAENLFFKKEFVCNPDSCKMAK